MQPSESERTSLGTATLIFSKQKNISLIKTRVTLGVLTTFVHGPEWRLLKTAKSKTRQVGPETCNFENRSVNDFGVVNHMDNSGVQPRHLMC